MPYNYNSLHLCGSNIVDNHDQIIFHSESEKKQKTNISLTNQIPPFTENRNESEIKHYGRPMLTKNTWKTTTKSEHKTYK